MGESYTEKSFSTPTRGDCTHNEEGRKERLKGIEKKGGGEKTIDHGIPINQTFWENGIRKRSGIKLKSISITLCPSFFFLTKSWTVEEKEKSRRDRDSSREKFNKNIRRVGCANIYTERWFRAVVCTFSLRANESVGARTSRRKCREWRQDANTLCTW